MSKTVDFYYDYGSPASYLAWTQIGRICAAHGATLNYRPVVLGAIFKASGNASPAMVPAKGCYVFKDFARWALHWGVPLRLNPHFPINTLTLMRLAYGVQLRHPDRFDAFNALVFRALWVDGLNFNQPELVAEALAAAGFAPALVADLLEDAEVKAGIRATTDEAIALGAFGAPTFMVDGEMYWGQDRLFMVEEALAGVTA